MTTEHKTLDQQIIDRYVGQPERLPTDARREIEARWLGQPVQLYALADLDHDLRLTQQWLALGPGHVAVASARPDGGWSVHSIDRGSIRSVSDATGLSASTLTLTGDPGQPPLAVLRYSHRQRRAMENIRFILEEALEGRNVRPPSPDR